MRTVFWLLGYLFCFVWKDIWSMSISHDPSGMLFIQEPGMNLNRNAIEYCLKSSESFVFFNSEKNFFVDFFEIVSTIGFVFVIKFVVVGNS